MLLFLYFVDLDDDGGAIGPSAARTPLILSFCFFGWFRNTELADLLVLLKVEETPDPTVTIREPDGNKFPVPVDPDDKIGDVKFNFEAVQEQKSHPIEDTKEGECLAVVKDDEGKVNFVNRPCEQKMNAFCTRTCYQKKK